MANQRVFEALIQIDPKFNEENFLAGARMAFELLMRPFPPHNIDIFQKVLSPKLYEIIKTLPMPKDKLFLETYAQEIEKCSVDDVRFTLAQALPFLASLDAEQAKPILQVQIDVEFVSRESLIIKQLSDGTVLHTKEVPHIPHTWTFEGVFNDPKHPLSWRLVHV
jgi:hypothetical protein